MPPLSWGRQPVEGLAICEAVMIGNSGSLQTFSGSSVVMKATNRKDTLWPPQCICYPSAESDNDSVKSSGLII